MRRALELGINFIGTADSYSPEASEHLIAGELYPHPRVLVIEPKQVLFATVPIQWTESIPWLRAEGQVDVFKGRQAQGKI